MNTEELSNEAQDSTLPKGGVSGSLPFTEEEIWDKIDWDMQQWGMGQGECESLITKWKYRYKIALKNWFDGGTDR